MNSDPNALMEYLNIRDELQTGDVLLFAGLGEVSRWIMFGSRSDWSHVGIVVRIPGSDLVMVYQSTTLSKVKDWASGVPRQGVQMNSLHEVVESYNGSIAVRRLTGVDRDEEFQRKVLAFRREFKGRPYEKKKMELLKAVYDGPFGHNEEDLRSVFCSELAAELFQRFGVIAEKNSSNEYVPEDFARMDVLLNGAQLEPIQMIKVA